MKALRANLALVLACYEVLTKITQAIKFVTWPLSSDVKQIFVRELSHCILVQPAWNEIVALISGKTLWTIANDATLMTKIHQCAYDLEYIEKPIRTKCEEWRRAFPRLYQLDDTKLLNLMEEFPKADSIAGLFNAKELRLSACGEIRALVGESGEELPLIHPVCTKGCVCEALKKLEASMRESVQEAVLHALETRKMDKEWHARNLFQAVCVALRVEWGRHVDEAMASENPSTALTTCLEVLKGELKLMVESIPTLTGLPLIKAQRTASLLFRLSHLTETLLAAKSKTEASSIYQNLVKFYWRNGTIIARCNDDFVEYGYEYHGCHEHLIYTPGSAAGYPLAMASFNHMIMAMIAGPAGVGKTETVKDVALMLGKPCIVLNCSEDLTVHALDRVTRGIAYCGGVLILDEVNRMNPEKKYLDFYPKLLELRAAGCREFVEDGKRIPIAPHFTVISTCNPGYAGRFNTEGFTAVTFTVPDFRVVAEGLAYNAGLLNARELSAKVVSCLNELKDKLSKAPQYDFGMRKMKKVIHLVANLVFKSGMSEADAVPHAFHLTTEMGLAKADIKPYQDIMKAHFKEAAEAKVLNLALFKYLAEAPEKLSERVVHQLVGVYDALVQNMPILLLTTDNHLLEILARAVAKLYPADVATVQEVDANVPPLQYNGEYKNGVWVPGILERTLMAMDNSKPSWVIVKGALNPINTEILHTILDFKRFQSCDGSVKIFSSAIKFIFQSPNAEHLSPAFVSRCWVFNFA